MKKHAIQNIFVDGQALLSHKSGIGFYTMHLLQALSNKLPDTSFHVVGLSKSALAFDDMFHTNVEKKIVKFPREIYLTLLEHHISIPIDLFTGRSDIYLFTDFIAYPHIYGKSIVFIHDLAFLFFPEFIEKHTLQHLRKLVPPSLEHADHVVAVSESTKTTLIEIFNIPKEKISVLYPIVDFTKDINEPDMDILHRIPTKEYFLFVGNIEPRKNILNIIEGYKNLPKEVRQKYTLVLAGGIGWNTDEIMQSLQQVVDAGNIICTGYISQEQKNTLYAHATLFIYPSFYEGFGMPLLEAMNHELPCVTSDIPVHHEICKEAAYYINPYEPAAITKAICICLEDTSLRKQFVSEGKKRVEYFKRQNQTKILLDSIYTLIS